MKIFVTGGTGFIGSHFLDHALGAGHEIFALRREGSKTRIPLKTQPNWIDGRLDEDFSDIFEGIDVFVHLASHTANPPYASLSECIYWNVYASQKICESAAKAGVKNFLIAGSCFEYGYPEEGSEPISPSSRIRPFISYPISKAAASVAFLGMARNLNLRMKILRIFQAYGEGESENRFWPSLKKAAQLGLDFPMSKGDQIRDFIEVSLVAKAILEEINFQQVQNGYPQIKNIGSGEGTSLLDFAKKWWVSWGARGRLMPGAIPQREADVPKLVANISEIYVDR